MAFFRNVDSSAAIVLDSNPDEDVWVEITEAEYEALIDSFPQTSAIDVHADLHFFLDGAGITDTDARAAFHRLWGVGH